MTGQSDDLLTQILRQVNLSNRANPIAKLLHYVWAESALAARILNAVTFDSGGFVMNWSKKNWLWLVTNSIAILPLVGIITGFNVDFSGAAPHDTAFFRNSTI